MILTTPIKIFKKSFSKTIWDLTIGRSQIGRIMLMFLSLKIFFASGNAVKEIRLHYLERP